MRLAVVVGMAAALQGAGNSLVISQRSEPRTFNPVLAVDAPTRDVHRLLNGRLVRINGSTLGTEPSLARSWKFSRDGRSCVVELRRGVRFSDGEPFDARDVVFSFEAYQDPKVASPQRDLLSPNGKPIRATMLGSHTLRFDFAEPHAPGERLFDALSILPRRHLEKAYREGNLAKAWTLATPPEQMAGLGPFMVERHVPGQRLVLRRNPHYWQAGKPKLDSVEILFTADQTAEALRFRNGEIDLIQRPPARAFAAFEGATKSDSGASLEYHFLFFNMNGAEERLSPALREKQKWFRDPAFRKAVSLAADRTAMSKIAFGGLAASLAHHVTPGNRLWLVETQPPRRSVEEASRLLSAAGFRKGSRLTDAAGRLVEFTLAVNSANAPHVQMATILQSDLAALGIEMRVTPLEFRSLVDRVLKTLDYEAALMALGSGDADPNSEMNVWLNDGSMHVWNLNAAKRPEPWEAEIDRLMRAQRSVRNQAERRKLYGQVQRLVAANLPIVALVSPNMLTAHRPGLRNVRPSILPPYALWNIEDFEWEQPRR